MLIVDLKPHVANVYGRTWNAIGVQAKSSPPKDAIAKKIYRRKTVNQSSMSRPSWS